MPHTAQVIADVMFQQENMMDRLCTACNTEVAHDLSSCSSCGAELTRHTHTFSSWDNFVNSSIADNGLLFGQFVALMGIINGVTQAVDGDFVNGFINIGVMFGLLVVFARVRNLTK